MLSWIGCSMLKNFTTFSTQTRENSMLAIFSRFLPTPWWLYLIFMCVFFWFIRKTFNVDYDSSTLCRRNLLIKWSKSSSLYEWRSLQLFKIHILSCFFSLFYLSLLFFIICLSVKSRHNKLYKILVKSFDILSYFAR